MSDAASIFRSGMRSLAIFTGALAGALIQAGTSTSFSGAFLTDVEQVPGLSQNDVKTRRLVLPSTGITGVVPLAGSRLVFSNGDDTTTSWLVESAEPLAPGGVVASWTLTLTDWDRRPL